MKIKCKKCGEIHEVSDKKIEEIILSHEQAQEQKKINEKAVTEVENTVKSLEDTLAGLKKDIDGLKGKIEESDMKINEEVILE